MNPKGEKRIGKWRWIKDDRWGLLDGSVRVGGARKGEINSAKGTGKGPDGKRRGGSCQDDLSLPPMDPDAALFSMCVCVCVCVHSKIEILLSATEQCSELTGSSEAVNQLLSHTVNFRKHLFETLPDNPRSFTSIQRSALPGFHKYCEHSHRIYLGYNQVEELEPKTWERAGLLYHRLPGAQHFFINLLGFKKRPSKFSNIRLKEKPSVVISDGHAHLHAIF